MPLPHVALNASTKRELDDMIEASVGDEDVSLVRKYEDPALEDDAD